MIPAVVEPGVRPRRKLLDLSRLGVLFGAIVLIRLISNTAEPESDPTYEVPQPGAPNFSIGKHIRRRGHEVRAVQHVQLHSVAGRRFSVDLHKKSAVSPT